MCGIIGIFGGTNSLDKAHQSLEKISHRGSKLYEIIDFGTASLGANRLPIVDRQHGIQPQANGNKTVFAVLNGEIFNHCTLREELQKKGYYFKTSSDTEVLANLFQEYGPEMVNMLDSEMFAFIVYDQSKNQVFAARDRLGVKPLYYAYDSSGSLYFCSELKQLSGYSNIKKIYTFPPGYYYNKGEFVPYFELKASSKIKKEQDAICILEKNIIRAVQQRVQTDLPIGVFLSGGVDSSLIMELATRFHPDVTALILGYPDSPDYEFALKLCKERKYKFHIIRPDIDYEKELSDLIYYLESYEPLIVRQSFASHLCAKEAQRLGLKVVLVGEGSDELFAGYNEFASLPNKLINKGCAILNKSLANGHLQRVDRMSMRHTVEVRSPFLDTDVVETALSISGSLKIQRKDHQVTTKYILRKVASNFLPSYIAWRYKMPFSNGAGMNVGSNYKSEDGDVAKIASKTPYLALSETEKKRFKLTTKESQFYFSKYKSYGFTKLDDSHKRLVVKDNISELHSSKYKRLLVAEFDRLALYFPVYFTAEKGFFHLHGLEVDFIATGGDDKTYSSLVNNSAHIGLADPMFAMIENKESIKGEIVGSLVNHFPNVAVTIDPSIQINQLTDFSKYTVGTFQEFSTTHSVAKYLLSNDINMTACDHRDLKQKLVTREIDVAIVLPEQALDLCSEGGRILFDFKECLPKFLFSGFTVAETIDPYYRKSLKSFLAAVRESLRYIFKNKEEAYKTFIRLFPNLKDPQGVYDHYVNLWSRNLKVEKIDFQNAHKVWKKNYPHLLKTYSSYFYRPSLAEPVLEKITSTQFRREFPFLEDILEERIIEGLLNGKPLKLVGFWGAGPKSKVDKADQDTLQFFKKYIDTIKSVYKPGVEVLWLLADNHGLNNEYKDKDIKQYLDEIYSFMKIFSFDALYLSELWDKWGISSKLVQKQLETCKNKPFTENDSLYRKIVEQAEKRFNGENKLLGAAKYYFMRMLEKPWLEKEFKNDVFFVYSDSQLQPIYPLLPTLYLYAQGPGKSQAPWFTEFN